MEDTIPALTAPPASKDNPLTRSLAGMIGMGFLALIVVACLASLPWTLGAVTTPGSTDTNATPRYNAGTPKAGRLPPSWWPHADEQARRLNRLVDAQAAEQIAKAANMPLDEALESTEGPVAGEIKKRWPTYLLGTDAIGRDLFTRVLTGGGISLGIGLAAAAISVFIGTVYGSVAAYAGGKVDAVMMRIVDILYGLPYILLVVLLAVAVDAKMEDLNAAHVRRISEQRQAWVAQALAPVTIDEAPEDRVAELQRTALDRFGTGEMSASRRAAIDVFTLLVAIGGVSWLTMARVVRGQVLSLKAQPFMEAARAIGVPLRGQFLRHLLPNLLGPIIVYTTLTVPQAILQESFLSFLGIGVKPPLPSWGNLAADGLPELNPYQSHWWLLLFPCLLLGTTLLALNFVGEGLREAFDPKRRRTRA
jgi:ABC-type dipeptide/oligopeptide/nickel transport system permease subunit